MTVHILVYMTKKKKVYCIRVISHVEIFHKDYFDMILKS